MCEITTGIFIELKKNEASVSPCEMFWEVWVGPCAQNKSHGTCSHLQTLANFPVEFMNLPHTMQVGVSTEVRMYIHPYVRTEGACMSSLTETDSIWT